MGLDQRASDGDYETPGSGGGGDGDPGKTRTSDTQFRKLLLYPPELRGHVFRSLPTRM